jgi:ParB family transcriptional regulator, chromosome partitioning protein
MSAKHAETIVESGTEIFIPLNKLKKSPKNARKTPHSEAAIEAYAASIAAKGILQNLVVEPELDGDERLPASIPSPSARAGGLPSFCG